MIQTLYHATPLVISAVPSLILRRASPAPGRGPRRALFRRYPLRGALYCQFCPSNHAIAIPNFELTCRRPQRPRTVPRALAMPLCRSSCKQSIVIPHYPVVLLPCASSAGERFSPAAALAGPPRVSPLLKPAPAQTALLCSPQYSASRKAFAHSTSAISFPPQLLHQPVLMRPVVAFHAPFRLAASSP